MKINHGGREPDFSTSSIARAPLLIDPSDRPKTRRKSSLISQAASPSPSRAWRLTPLELQSRFGGKPIKFQVRCPQNGTAVRKRVKGFLRPPRVKLRVKGSWLAPRTKTHTGWRRWRRRARGDARRRSHLLFHVLVSRVLC